MAAMSVAILMAAGFARADTITLTYNMTPVEGATLAPSYQYDFSLNKFDTSLGTLTGVELQQVTSIVPEIQIYNITGGTLPFDSASTHAPISFAGPDGTSSLVAADYTIGANTVSSLETIFSPALPTIVTGSVNVQPANFASYEGTGTANFTTTFEANSSSITTGAPGGTIFVGGSMIAGGSFAVTYTYTPVPEPSTIALLATGLISLLGYARRRAA